MNSTKQRKNSSTLSAKGYTMRELHDAYLRGENIIKMLKKGNTDEYNFANKMKFIEIAYDLQAGSYVEAMKDPVHAQLKRKKCAEMAAIVSKYIPNPKSLLKAGVGEAVTLVPFLQAFENSIPRIEGFDISWSRISYARQFLNDHNFDSVKLCTGTLQSIPYVDNSFDVIMTSHAMEPNGGYEEVILKELARVSNSIVALFEPSFEMATPEGKERMISHGYVQRLPEIAQDLGFEILYNEPLQTAMRKNNPTAALILKVASSESAEYKPAYACPITKKRLTWYDKGYFSKESFLYYPSINNMATLRKENGILASSINILNDN